VGRFAILAIPAKAGIQQKNTFLEAVNISFADPLPYKANIIF
jgi:hypothetical protein